MNGEVPAEISGKPAVYRRFSSGSYDMGIDLVVKISSANLLAESPLERKFLTDHRTSIRKFCRPINQSNASLFWVQNDRKKDYSLYCFGKRVTDETEFIITANNATSFLHSSHCHTRDQRAIIDISDTITEWEQLGRWSVRRFGRTGLMPLHP